MAQGGRQEPGYGSGYGDDYAADEDDYYTYDATDEDDEGRRRPMVILAIIALIVVFAGVVFFAYKQGLKQGAQGNPPIIRADNSPLKVPPVNPGGIEIPHQDRAVYDRLSGSGETAGDDGAEHLLPRAEEPIEMATPAPQRPASAPEPDVAAVEPAPVAPVITSPTVPAAPSAATAKPSESTSVSASGAGGFVVQLAAFRDEPSALDAFRKLQSKYPSLASLGADIQRADLGDKGIYYRLRAGYLDKSEAQALCSDLESRGQGCFVRAK